MAFFRSNDGIFSFGRLGNSACLSKFGKSYPERDWTSSTLALEHTATLSSTPAPSPATCATATRTEEESPDKEVGVMWRQKASEGSTGGGGGLRRGGTFADIFSSSGVLRQGQDEDALLGPLLQHSSSAPESSASAHSNSDSRSPSPPTYSQRGVLASSLVGAAEDTASSPSTAAMRHSVSSAAIIDIGRIDDWRYPTYFL